MSERDIGIPNQSTMLPLARDFSGLRAHSLLVTIFVPEPNVDAITRKLRTLLVHCLQKAARHYESAKNLVEAQIKEGLRSPEEMTYGRELPILDFALEFEDCVNAINRAQLASEALRDYDPTSSIGKFLDEQAAGLTAINDIRRATEHMEERIVKDKLEGGPFLVCVSADGNHAILGKHGLAFTNLKLVIEALFDAIAKLFSTYQANPSGILSQGPIRITASATLTTTTSNEEKGSC